MHGVLPDLKQYRSRIDKDYRINCAFRGGQLDKRFLNSYEWKFIKCYRKCQCNRRGLWGKIYRKQLRYLEYRTGFSFENNMTILAQTVFSLPDIARIKKMPAESAGKFPYRSNRFN